MATQAGWDRYGSSKRYQSGEYIFEEGDPADYVYVITSGRVAIIKNIHADNQLILGYVGAGELLGEIGMWTNERRTASVMAAETIELLEISRDDFWRLFDEDWAFRHLITNEMVRHILSADQSRLAAAATERALSALIEIRQATTRFIVHDLQNPLHLIMMALSMIEEDLAYNPQDEVAEYIDSAKRSTSRMLTLVESLLDTERLDSGSYTLDLVPVDMAHLIHEVISHHQTTAQQKNIELTLVQPVSSQPTVKADRRRMDRVLTNLVDNALKFTPNGGRIWIDVSIETDNLVIGVNNTGPSIPSEQREQIFERFVQADVKQETHRGFGLGLAYCRLAIQLHGGRIWVEDGPGGTGVRFVFTLPREAVLG
ncbi:MAG: cyclic nucleotide-binding domain-containing protein [Anaerolineae bacterium]|nr:cyclic nucleotide-binding domain-containing protein [Anaerolineae bacterium]